MYNKTSDKIAGFDIADIDSVVPQERRGSVFRRLVTLIDESERGRGDYRSTRIGDKANQLFWRLDPTKPPSRGSVVGSYSSSIPSSPSKGEWLPLRKPGERDEDYQKKPSGQRDNYNEGVFASYGYGGSKLPGKAEYLVSATVGHGDRVPMAFGGGGPLVAQHRGPDLHDYSIWVWDIDQNGDLGIGSPLHSAFHVREWPAKFCPDDPSKTASSFEHLPIVNQVALQFTKSEKDNTGWGAVHHASKDGVLSAEAFGPIRDGAPKHNIIDNVFREAIDIDRAVFGDGTDLWSAPIQFTRSRWRRGRNGPIITNPQLRMDTTRLHPHNCGNTRQGMWDFEDYAFLTDWSDPTSKQEDDGGPNKSPIKDPGGVKKPTDNPPDTLIDPGGIKGPDGWPVDDIIYPSPWGEADSTIDGVAGGPAEIESPSEYGHPRPNGPDSSDNRRHNTTFSSSDLRGEIDAFWQSRYGFTEREFLEQPITHHGIAGAVYDSATRANGPNGWVPVFSQVPEIEELQDGVLWRKKAGLGSGHYTVAPANIRLHHTYNGATLPSDALDYSFGVFAANGWDTRFGMGHRLPNSAFFARGFDISLDFTNDPDNPDILFQSRDETGGAGSGTFKFNGTEVTTGGIGGSTGSTDNAILRADGTGGSTVQASGLLVSDVTGGVVSVRTPDSTLSYSNGITIKTGDTTSADDTGAVVVDAGAPSGGTAGGISIGTANASAVTLGRSGQTIVANTNLVMPKTSGVGIKVDTASPTFGWRDLLGEIQIRGTGGTDPTYLTYNSSGIRAFFFAVNDEVFLAFHIPHDYVPGSDIHLHFHWSQDEKTTAGAGTNPVTGGSVTWGYEIMYAKGHQQAAFGASVSGTVLQSASTTKNHHHIAEVQVSAASPSASQIDSDNLEPDGVILCRAYLSANGMTVSSGNVPAPVLHYCDVHYQSTGMATKNKAPNFYS